MQVDEYMTWREVPPSRSRHLLDWDTGQPTVATLASADGALARIAAVIHAHGAQLDPADIELIVSWVKAWKRDPTSAGRPHRDAGQFREVLFALRDSPAQRCLSSGWVREIRGQVTESAGRGDRI